MKYFGLDHGSKTIGIAIGDDIINIASPLLTIKKKKFKLDALKLFNLVDEYGVEALIIGLPLNMDGSAGARVQSVKTFAHNLQSIRNIPVYFQDERLSTHTMQQMMIENDVSRAKREKRIDALAAQWILQAFLDLKAL